jgi:LmbE family N-acetylglucosaminyl deacetylase
LFENKQHDKRLLKQVCSKVPIFLDPKKWVMYRNIMETVINHNAVPLETLPFPNSMHLLVLAPHPDDFDAIGVTMRFFHQNGNPLSIAVATSGVNGVEDTFCSPPTSKLKAEIREQEQKASCRFFGLPESNLAFLRLAEDESGRLLENNANISRVRQYIQHLRPEMVFLPHWNDTNLTHQRVYAMFRKLALEADYPLVAFLNRDPKTIQMRCDVYFGFGEKEASWKGKLLRFHRSQQQRNLNQRGYGMDERILRVDRQSAAICSAGTVHAEVFELEFFRSRKLKDFLNYQKG